MNQDDDNKAEFFVSRRGRQVGVHEVDMNGIDIESTVDTSKLQKKEVKPVITTRQKQQPVKPIRAKTSWPKRKKLAVLGTVLVLLITPIILAELVTAQYSTGTSGAKSDMNSLITSTVLPAQKKASITADNIRDVSNRVNVIASQMCRGGLLDNMAKLYPRAQSAYDECKAVQNKYVSLVTSLYTLESQARYLEKVDVIIKPISTPIADEFAVIGAQQDAWKKASEDFKTLPPPSDFKSVHTELSTHLSAVADNWSKLRIPNNNMDPVAFETAEKALNMGFEAVRSTSSQYVTILSGTQGNVLAAYNVTK